MKFFFRMKNIKNCLNLWIFLVLNEVSERTTNKKNLKKIIFTLNKYFFNYKINFPDTYDKENLIQILKVYIERESKSIKRRKIINI